MNVRFHDPYVPEIAADSHTPEGAVGKSVPLTDQALREADAVMIVTDHSNIDYEWVARLANTIIDTRNACGSRPGAAAGTTLRESVPINA